MTHSALWRILTAPEISCDIKTYDPRRDQDALARRGDLCSGSALKTEGAPAAFTHRDYMSSQFSLFGNMKAVSDGIHESYSEVFLIEDLEAHVSPLPA